MIPEWGGGGSFAIDRVRARIKVRMERAENGPWRRCITAPRTKEKQMSNQVIPAGAVQAAHAAICEQNLDDCLDPDWRGKCVKAVEAAGPYLQAAAWDEGRQAEEDAPPLSRTAPNPYRSHA